MLGFEGRLGGWPRDEYRRTLKAKGTSWARTQEHERARDVGDVRGWQEKTCSWHRGFQGNTKKVRCYKDWGGHKYLTKEVVF